MCCLCAALNLVFSTFDLTEIKCLMLFTFILLLKHNTVSVIMSPLNMLNHKCKLCNCMARVLIGRYSSAFIINPFTAPACKVSRLKEPQMRPQNSVFSSPITHLLSVISNLMKILSHASAKKKTKRLKVFKFHVFTVIFK